MNKEWLVKSFTLGIVVIFICVSFQPIIAEKTVSLKKESNNDNVDFEKVKEYLFQTLIDILNNPEVKQFLNEHKHDLITRNNNYDCKNAIQKISSQNPKLLKSIFITKPKMTYEYLETNYNRGLELYNILGEEESLKMIESIYVANPELFNELKDIIVNDKELYNRITTLGEMNEVLEPIPPFLRPICWILFISYLPSYFVVVFLGDYILVWLLKHNLQLLALIIQAFGSLFALSCNLKIFLMQLFYCL